ncbi:type I restriction endonuclease [Spiroplasma kunkelii]|uniref:type I restriction endonuclease n=1 Tax=Spiroplasma kunkelii TaxID=47834 RepID=UPI0006A9904D|nr:type I restriction endonuclease [Spiroplasma kunkelii]
MDLELFNKDKWCDNIFQFTNQLKIKSIFQNRYDIITLINGLPLIQIELKKPEINFKEAFNQINKYASSIFKQQILSLVNLMITSFKINATLF